MLTTPLYTFVAFFFCGSCEKMHTISCTVTVTTKCACGRPLLQDMRKVTGNRVVR